MTDEVTKRQNGLDILREAVTECFGERCDEDVPGCFICDAWAAVDEYEANAKTIALIKGELLDAISKISAVYYSLGD